MNKVNNKFKFKDKILGMEFFKFLVYGNKIKNIKINFLKKSGVNYVHKKH